MRKRNGVNINMKCVSIYKNKVYPLVELILQNIYVEEVAHIADF